MRSEMHKGERLYLLDIGRLFAIVAVMLYHFFSAHTESCPYGDAYPYFEYGYLGVCFFFILTGYTIIESMARSDSILSFWKKKLLRIWLPLFLCACLTYFFTRVISIALQGEDIPYQQSNTITNLLFSLTFLEPGTVNILLGTHFKYLCGGYWFLSAEIEFLLLISLCFFTSKKYFFPLWCGCSLLCVCMEHYTHAMVYTHYLQYFLWGMVCYQISQKSWHNLWWLLPVTIIPFGINGIYKPTVENMLICSILLFWIIYPLIKIHTNHLIENLSRLSIGVYETYLLHEVVGIILINQFAAQWGEYAWVFPVILIILFYILGIIMHYCLNSLITHVSHIFGKELVSKL